MTTGLLIFLALYVLIGQPAIVGWMLGNTELYQLAGLNAGVFLIALIISLIFKPSKPKTENAVKLVEKREEKVSRIENDDGVAIVEVEKKEEVVVESNNEDQEGLGEDVQELEEKVDDKKNEKTMKETVTIPKIVQPLTGHTATKKRKKERKWGQWLVLLLTLGIAGVIAWTLWEFLGNWGICIALFLGWILYLVIGKLFDVNGFYNAKKLFTNWLYIVLILAGIGYGVYAMQQEDRDFNLLPEGWSDKVVTYVTNLFKAKEKDNIMVDTGAIYIFEGTGEVINNIEENNNVLENEELNEDNQDGEGAELAENKEEENNEENKEEKELSPEEAKKQVTMGEAIKSLLDGTTLSTKTNSTFKYVSKSNELYPYFKTAQEKGMIGTDADPTKIISCETFITMKGLAEGWNVGNYVKSEIKSAYWKKATELGELNGCKKGAYVTKGNL